VLGGEVVALDGKSVRRALNRGEDFRVIVSAWATESGLLLGQRKVRDKSNEITVVPELLRALELAGCIVTADAMHCQKTSPKRLSRPRPITCWRLRAIRHRLCRSEELFG
jgi:hypothetical protein